MCSLAPAALRSLVIYVIHVFFYHCSLSGVLRISILCALLPVLAGCASSTRFNLAAERHNLVREDIVRGDLPVVVYRDQNIPHSSSIHFYFDGDGQPWVGGKRIAEDPTTRSKLILDLMAADPAANILIGRPCYYMKAHSRPASCNTSLWTSHRYSKRIVAVMREVIIEQIQKYRPQEIVLIGYSGGGTIAALIASELEDADVLITIAANLNVDLWSELHGYTPLARSLNEHNFPSLPKQLRQIHFVGSEDSNVPRPILQSIVDKQSNAKIIERVGYTHECCWPKDWASTLVKVLN